MIKSGSTQRSGALFCSNIVAALPRFEGVRDGVFGVFFGVTAPRHGRALFLGVFGTAPSSSDEVSASDEVFADPDPLSESSKIVSNFDRGKTIY